MSIPTIYSIKTNETPGARRDRLTSQPGHKMTNDLHTLTASQAVSAATTGTFLPQDYLMACLRRIEERNRDVKAFVHVSPSALLPYDDARQGPLVGIPVAIKDVIDTYDQPTEMGSSIYEGYQPTVDAAVVRLLRAAGALIVGKTATSEFAATTEPSTLNPHDLTKTPGASSSGSAAAVADFMVPIALGTQTGGSTIRPASYCGVYGFKPSFGRISRVGVKSNSESLDTMGWFARSIDDILLVDLALSGQRTAPAVSPGPVRVAVCRTPMWSRAKGETADALDLAAAFFRNAGNAVEQLQLPPEFNELLQLRKTINEYERTRALADEWARWPNQISVPLAQSIMRGAAISHSDYLEAVRGAEMLRLKVAALISDFDVLLAPSSDGEAPAVEEGSGDPAFQAFWTLLHLPCLNVPIHTGPGGLPVGVQLIGRMHDDHRLLDIARRLPTTFSLHPPM